MEIQPLGKRNLLIYIGSDELGDLPAPPFKLETGDAAGILKAALGEKHTDVWQNVYLELYAGKDSLLLFVRAHSGRPYYFAFKEIEPLISAAERCPSDVISYLIYCADLYYMVIYPWDKEPPPDALSEYGEELSLHAYYALHIAEHGTELLGPTALEDLKNMF